MKKIVSNILIVSTQLIIGGLFLFMLFSDNGDNRNVVVKNNNLDKMADSVSELFVADKLEKQIIDTKKEEELIAEEEALKKKEEEAKRKAEEEEARKRAEEEARIKSEEEAQRKAAEEEAARNAVYVDASGYISKPAAGFNVTTGNKSYSLNAEEFNVVAGVIGCEGAGENDMLAVASVIFNRADRNGSSPYVEVTRAGQFSCIYLYNASHTQKGTNALNAAISGIRNTGYTSFNCPGCAPAIDHHIEDRGNWYY